MSADQDFEAQLHELVRGEQTGTELLPSRLARAAALTLDADGAGISLFEQSVRVPLGASDAHAVAAERLQFTQGSGPCLEAIRTASPVIASAGLLGSRWPVLTEALTRTTPYRSLLSLPLRFPTGLTGALDLYLRGDDGGTRLNLVEAVRVAGRIADALTAAAEADDDASVPAWLRAPLATRRALVWVAIGILMATLELVPDDALARLRGHAFATNQTVDDVSRALVERRLAPGMLAL